MTVLAIDDHIVDGDVDFAVNLGPVVSADSEYNGLALNPVPVRNSDDDVPGSAFQLDGSGTVYVTDLEVAADGNLYVTGAFTDTADFDPGPGSTLITAGGSTSAFIAKYSATNELICVRSFGEDDDSTFSRALTLDSAGNVYLVGYTLSTSLSLGSTTLNNLGSSDAFVTKLNSAGDYLRARGWGGTSADTAEDIFVDSNQTLHITGQYQATVDFNPASGTTSRTSAGGNDGYVSKFDVDGNFLSVSSFGGTAHDYARKIEGDGNGNLFVAEYFNGVGQFGTLSLTSAGSSDGYLLKLTSTGTVAWARQAAGIPAAGTIVRLALTSSGDVYFATDFTGDIAFGASTPTLTSGGGTDVYITKWSTGGALLQTGQLTGSDAVTVSDFAVDHNDQPVVNGTFKGTVDMDPTAQLETRSSIGPQSDYILRLDSSNGLLDFYQMPRETGVARGLALDSRGNIYATGHINSTISMPTGEVLVNHQGSFDSYIVKLIVAPGVTLGTGGGLTTSEDGGAATFSVQLDTPPTDVVTISLSSSDPSEGTVSAQSLVFTPSNWDIPQTVTVTGVNDSIVDGNISYSIQLQATSAGDPGYSGLVIPAVSLTNLDNDAPLVLFADSFEVSEWNGLWVEDSQNDWFRSTQRATSGTRSAEVDGSASNATLTIANPIDLSNMASATLTFDWLIESSFDAGEFLSLDISTNGGTSWQNDVRRLSGNVSPENVWRSESVDLTSYTSSNLKVRFRSTVSATDEDANVDNVRIEGIAAGPNVSPIANAGGTYVLNEGASISLSSAGSTDPDGTITNYAWDLDGDGQFDDASGATAGFTTTNSGSYIVGLQVTDNRGAIATATATVTVNNLAPTANAGINQSGFVGTPLTLSAAGSSDPGNDIVSYAWDLDNDGLFDDASGVSTSFSAATAGTYTVRVRATDADGAASVDSAIITIAAAPSEVVVFADSFEVGEWNGLWVEDSQNDWFRSTQRATQGTRSAEVDGSATNATLTLASALNLSSYSAATLTFNWLIESSFDSGEYLSLDVSTNGGSSWIQDVRRLNGNVSAENVWHSESVNLAQYTSSNLKIRFRSTVSGSDEDANVDNVRIVALSGGAAAASLVAAPESTDDPSSTQQTDRSIEDGGIVPPIARSVGIVRSASALATTPAAALLSLSASAIDAVLTDDSDELDDLFSGLLMPVHRSSVASIRTAFASE